MPNSFSHIAPLGAVAVIAVVLYGYYRSGWNVLQKQYRFRGIFPKSSIRFIEGTFFAESEIILWYHKARSNLPIKVAVDHTGIYLAALHINRIFHSPLFIPWEDVSDSWFEQKIITKLFGEKFRSVLLTIRKAPGIALQVPQNVAEKMKQQAGVSWRSITV